MKALLFVYIKQEFAFQHFKIRIFYFNKYKNYSIDICVGWFILQLMYNENY